jgi:hypothetical protein
MGRILISNLKKKYGEFNIKNKKYQAIVNDIMKYNRNKISNDIANMTDLKIKRSFDTTTKGIVKFPIINDITKKHDLLALKAAEKGNYITQTLRDRLTSDLRETLGKMKPGTKLNQSLVKEFKSKIKETFTNYTKNDPRFGVPSNIRNISVTETKYAVNNIRKIYMNELMSRNPDLEYTKTWRHYKSYSKVYRRGHEEQNGKTIGMNDKFAVNEFQYIKGRWKKTGNVIMMDCPHDDQVNNLSEKIGCSCELKYNIIKKVNND